MQTDPIADLLTRIRNATCVRHDTVKIPYSKIKEKILQVISDEGFIDNWQVVDLPGTVSKSLEINLKYGPKNEAVIRGLKRVSRPGLRVYVKNNEIPRVLNGLGVAILSTSKGIMSGEASRQANLGGEHLCSIW